MELGEILFIDVRSKEEAALPPFLPKSVRSVHVEVTSSDSAAATMTSVAEMLPVGKHSPIVVFCATGIRSGFAMSALNDMGYTNLRNSINVGGALALVGQALREGLFFASMKMKLRT